MAKPTLSLLRRQIGNANNAKIGYVRPQGRMTEGYFGIYLKIFAFLLPPLLFAAIFSFYVFANIVPNEKSFYVNDQNVKQSLGSAFYVSVSASKLLFVASWTSTVVMTLIPIAMLLFSYPVAQKLIQHSDNQSLHDLPSPYQFDLLVRVLFGSTSSLWFLFWYLIDSKKKKLPIISELSKSVVVFVLILSLAFSITLADTWLHITTTSVRYFHFIPQNPQQQNEFFPGRSFSSDCFSAPLHCLFYYDAGGMQTIGVDEIRRVSANKSSVNRVLSHDLTSILGPISLPPGLDFSAASYGVSSSCKMVTTACNATVAQSTTSAEWHCSAENGGLNFENDLQYTANNFVNFNESQMTIPHIVTDDTNFFNYMASDPNLYWAFPFLFYSNGTLNQNAASKSDIIYTDYYEFGITACTTALSFITYTITNGTISTTTSTPLNQSTAQLFGLSTTSGTSSKDLKLQDLLFNEIKIAITSNNSSPADFAARIATAFDQQLLAMISGLAIPQPPLSMTRQIETLVTRMPKPPFVTLIVLVLLYILMGAGLAFLALRAVGGDTKDVQVRLGISGIVAGYFEPEGLIDEARDVKHMFAERRGLDTKRVMFSKTSLRGRKYELVGGGELD